MAMILDAFIGRYCNLLADLVNEEIIMLLGVENELQKLLQKMKDIRFLLKDAEKRRFDKDSPTDNWLSQLKDVMYDADDIIDLCRIKGTELLGNRNSRSEEPSPVCFNFSSSLFSCFANVPLRHEIGNKIKELNGRLSQIYENRNHLKLLENMEASETHRITLVNPRQTSPMIDPLVVGGGLEVATNKLVDLLIAEKAEEKCRLFAVTGMGGIGKTTLAQKIFNHQKIQDCFNSKVWICVSQTYKETELLKEVIRGLKGNYENAKTKAELLPILGNSFASAQSLFLVLDDVWRADVWLDLLRIPLQTTNSSVRVLVTTRYADDVAKVMQAAHIHNVRELSKDASWDMLRRLLFKDHEEQQANDLKELGLQILQRCGGLPLAIKAIAGVLGTREKTRTAWEQILWSDTWSVRDLHENHIAALHLSYEDLPSHLKQCFLYFSLYGEDVDLNSREFARLWVAEGFLTENQGNSSMEDVAESYFNELLGRNLLLSSHSGRGGRTVCKMHDIVRSLAIFLSKEETSCGDVSVKNSSITLTKLRRLSVADKDSEEAIDLVAKKGALRTLLAKGCHSLMVGERLMPLSCLRVLDISVTGMKELPDSIGNLVHLRYLDLSWTKINAIPESIKHLAHLQFLNLKSCECLKQLPNGITQLHNLRYLNLCNTPISFMPKGTAKLQQLNRLRGFRVANMDSSSNLVDLNSLKQLRSLRIEIKKEDQSDVVLLEELPHLSKLRLVCSYYDDVAVELLDNIIPPRTLKILKILCFKSPRFPNWMASFKNHVPKLTVLELYSIQTLCIELPPLGQLPELKELSIHNVRNVMRIGPQFLGDGVITSTTRIAFPKLERFSISYMEELEDWSFGAQVEENASPRLMLLPCLHKLEISHLKLLKQLPKGLKYSAMKSLRIFDVEQLKSVDDLPPKIEELELINNHNLEKVCPLPMLKKLHIDGCSALSTMEQLDSLQNLHFKGGSENLPGWLLIFLRQWVLQNDTNKDFLLDLRCSEKAFQKCLEGGSYWEIIQYIPRVIARDFYGSYLHYEKQPSVYNTKICDPPNPNQCCVV